MNPLRSQSNLPYRSNVAQPPQRIPCSSQRRAATVGPGYQTYTEYEHDDYDATHPGHPILRSRRSADLPRSYHGHADEFAIPRVSTGLGPHWQQQSPRLPFDRAASNLYAVLTESRNIFKGFLDEFDRDVKDVRTYADHKILEVLWRRKIEGVEKRSEEERSKREQEIRTAAQQAQAQGQGYLPTPPPPPPLLLPPTFTTTSNQLMQTLTLAASSLPSRSSSFAAPPPPPPPTLIGLPPPPPPQSSAQHALPSEFKEEIDSMKRLIKKLQSQHRDLIELIHGSRRSTRKCTDLVQDLELLVKVLENSEGLWRDRSRVENGMYGG